MKPENKLPVLDLISAEMKTVVNTLQPDLPPWPATGTIAEQRQYYTLERRFWNAGAPEMATRAYMVPTKYGQVETRLFCPQPDSPATLFYLHGGGFILGNLDTHDRIMRLLASYSQCTVIGIDYTLSPEARFPQAIEEIVAACCYFHQQAEDYQINMSRIGFAGDSAGAMLALASALWLRDKQIDCGKVAGVLLWYGLYGLRDSVTRRLLGGVWDGLTQQDLQMYEEAYLSNDADRESPYYCLFNRIAFSGQRFGFIFVHRKDRDVIFEELLPPLRILGNDKLGAQRQHHRYVIFLRVLNGFHGCFRHGFTRLATHQI